MVILAVFNIKRYILFEMTFKMQCIRSTFLCLWWIRTITPRPSLHLINQLSNSLDENTKGFIFFVFYLDRSLNEIFHHKTKKIYCNICFFVSWWTVSNTTMEIAGFIYYLAVLWRINYWCNLLHNWCLYKSSLVI